MKDFKSLQKKWDLTSDFEDKISFLLRLDLLRETYFQLHQMKSEHLEDSQDEEKKNLILWEKNIQTASFLPSLPLKLKAYLENPPTPIKNLPETPEGLKKIIPDIKLNRFDREFEKTICIRAYEAQCLFYEITYEVPLTDIQEFHDQLKVKLWPKALVLFVESHSDNKTVFQSKAPLWKGIWTTLFLPHIEINEINEILKQFHKNFTAHSLT